MAAGDKKVRKLATTPTVSARRQRGFIGWGRSLAGRLIQRAFAPMPLQRKRPIVEALEPRLLLSTSPLPQPTFGATLSYDAVALGGPLDAVLHVIDTGAATPFLELRRSDPARCRCPTTAARVETEGEVPPARVRSRPVPGR